MPVTLYDASIASHDDHPVPLSALPSRVVEPVSGWEVCDVIEAGGGYGMNSFVLVTPEIEANVQAGRSHTVAAAFNLLGLRADGSVYFQGGQRVAWVDFKRGADAGLFKGDVERIVFYDYGTAGGHGVEVVPDILQWIADGTASLLGLVALAEAKGTFTERRRKKLADQWRQNGVLPSKLRKYVLTRTHHDPKILAQQFGMSENEARFVLTRLGLRDTASGLWRRPSPSP